MSDVNLEVTGLQAFQVAAFWDTFPEKDPNKCWEWPHGRMWRGYGQIMFNSRKFLTHRLAWMLANGKPIPARFHVCHSCDNSACCNPSHLRVGTPKENDRDCVTRGRKPRGELHARSKLNEMAIRYIRRLRGQGETMKALATAFCVDVTTIFQVVSRATWQHVQD